MTNKSILCARAHSNIIWIQVDAVGGEGGGVSVCGQQSANGEYKEPPAQQNNILWGVDAHVEV